MDQETLRAAIDFSLRSMSPEVTIVFLGGEPLLELNSIRAAIDFSRRQAFAARRMRYQISTNGLLIDDSAAAFLDEHGCEIQLSFDGVEEAQNLRAKGTFAAIDGLLERLRRNQPDMYEHRLRVCITLTPPAVPHLSDSIDYLVRKGVRRIGLSPSLVHHPEWKKARIEELDSQFATVYEASLKLFRETGETPVTFLRKSASEAEGRQPAQAMCGLAAANRLAIDVDGKAYGCASLAESYQEFHSDLLKASLPPLRLGDLRDPEFDARFAAFPQAVRNSELFYYRERKYSLYGKCGDCEYANRCSVCPMSIGYDQGNTDPHRVPDFVCAFNRTALKYRALFPPTPNPLERLMALLDRTAD